MVHGVPAVLPAVLILAEKSSHWHCSACSLDRRASRLAAAGLLVGVPRELFLRARPLASRYTVLPDQLLDTRYHRGRHQGQIKSLKHQEGAVRLFAAQPPPIAFTQPIAAPAATPPKMSI